MLEDMFSIDNADNAADNSRTDKGAANLDNGGAKLATDPPRQEGTDNVVDPPRQEGVDESSVGKLQKVGDEAAKLATDPPRQEGADDAVDPPDASANNNEDDNNNNERDGFRGLDNVDDVDNGDNDQGDNDQGDNDQGLIESRDDRQNHPIEVTIPEELDEPCFTCKKHMRGICSVKVLDPHGFGFDYGNTSQWKCVTCWEAKNPSITHLLSSNDIPNNLRALANVL